MTTWCRRWSRPDAGRSCPICAAIGPTRFLAADTPRSGQQAALGNDLKELMDALGVERAALVGYDWGGRAACIVAALWPERVRGLVSGNGYNIQDIAAIGTCRRRPSRSIGFWYQYYFHTERGRAGLAGEPARVLPVDLAVVVAELAVRRRDLRTHRRVVRQSGLRRRDDPLLPPPLRLRAGRSAPGADRAAPGRAAAHRGADHRAARRRQRRLGAGKLAHARAVLHRPVSAPGDPGRRPQSAAGGAEDVAEAVLELVRAT